MTDRPVKRISDGLERLTEGNFSERIEPFSDPLGSNQYNVIVERIKNELGCKVSVDHDLAIVMIVGELDRI